MHFHISTSELTTDHADTLRLIAAIALEHLSEAQRARITGEWDLFSAVFEMVTSVTVVLLLREGLHYNEIKDHLLSEEMAETAAPYKVDQPDFLPGLPGPPPLPPSERRLAVPRRGMSAEERRAFSHASANGDILAQYGRSLSEWADRQELPPAYFERTGFVPLATMDRRVGPEEIAAEIMAAAPEYHVALFAVLGGLAAAQ